MAVTVLGKNYSQIESCDTTDGAWSETEEVDSNNYKEGSGSLSFTLKASGLNTLTLSNISVDFTASSSHLRFWFLDSAAGLLANTATAIEVGVSDGSNTGYWNLNHERYEGGWKNFCVDTENPVDSGTKPSNMNAITSIIFRITQIGGGKNFDNVWIDNVCKSDGLIAYGDDGGGYFDFDDIYSADNTSLGHGIIRKIGGVYYIVGSLDIGDSTGSNACKFQAKSQIAVVEDRPIAADLCTISIVATSGSNITEFILGDKSGVSGIQGCTIRVADTDQTAKVSLDGTDTNITDFKLYGSTFYGAAAIDFPSATASTEVIGCTFEKCGQVIADDTPISQSFFIDTVATAALLWNSGIDIEDSSFIANTAGAGVEHSTQDSVNYIGLVFTGNTFDIVYTAPSSSGVLTINADSESQVSTSEITNPTGNSVSILSSKPISIHVENEAGNNIQNAQVYIQKAAGGVAYGYTSDPVNASGNSIFLVNEAVATDLPQSGWLHVLDWSDNTKQNYRYTSWTTKTFSMYNEVTGACTGGETATKLQDTGGIDFTATNIEEGDTVRNTTDGSWAVVDEIVSATKLLTSKLRNGSDNTWESGDTYSFHKLARDYTASDLVDIPLMNIQTDADGDADGSYNWGAIGQTLPIVVRIRSNTGGTKYVPYRTSGSITTNGYSLTAVLLEDEVSS